MFLYLELDFPEQAEVHAIPAGDGSTEGPELELDAALSLGVVAGLLER